MQKEVKNPWEGIKGPPFYFEEDKKIIDKFNSKLEKNPHFIHSDLMPEPYMGNPKANVILLFANPGYGKNERNDYKIPGFQDAIINNLTHSNKEYPYYYLNPGFVHPSSDGKPKYTDGGKWVLARTKKLRKELNIDEKELSKKIFTIQLHPYHSEKFKPVKEKFVGHQYTMYLFFDAVERAIKGEALIVCARSYSYWNTEYQMRYGENADLINDLKTNFIKMKYPRSVYFTSKNLGEENFNNLKNKLNDKVK